MKLSLYCKDCFQKSVKEGTFRWNVEILFADFLQDFDGLNFLLRIIVSVFASVGFEIWIFAGKNWLQVL